NVASKKTTGNSRRKGNALTTARKQRIVARIKDNTAKDLAFDKRALLVQDELRCAGRHIKNLDVLQRVSQGSVRVCIDWLAQFEQEPVIALVVKGAQIVCLVVKSLTSERKAAIEEIRFADSKNKILSFRSVLKT